MPIDRRTFLEETLRGAGQILREHFGHVTTDRVKGGDPHSIVTAADMAAHHFLEEKIRTNFPDDLILSEEDDATHSNAQAERVWIFDPLDGTRNFASRVPLFGVLIAYCERGEVQLSGIYLPMTDELAVAEAGRGATLNGLPMKTSGHTDFSSSFGIGPSKLGRESTARFVAALYEHYPEHSPWVSGLSCVAVSAIYLADGRRDWYMSYAGGVWDYAAPSLILHEAGCAITSFDGTPWTLGNKAFAASTPALHSSLLELLK